MDCSRRTPSARELFLATQLVIGVEVASSSALPINGGSVVLIRCSPSLASEAATSSNVDPSEDLQGSANSLRPHALLLAQHREVFMTFLIPCVRFFLILPRWCSIPTNQSLHYKDIRSSINPNLFIAMPSINLPLLTLRAGDTTPLLKQSLASTSYYFVSNGIHTFCPTRLLPSILDS